MTMGRTAGLALLLLVAGTSGRDCGSSASQPHVSADDCAAFDSLWQATQGAWTECSGNPCGVECTNHDAVCRILIDGRVPNPDSQSGVCCALVGSTYRITRVIMPPALWANGFATNTLASFVTGLASPPALEILDVSEQSRMSVSGGRLPSELCDLTTLKSLRVADTKFYGAIPPCVFTALRALLVLDLHSNTGAGFSGALPSPAALRARWPPSDESRWCNLIQAPTPLLRARASAGFTGFTCPVDETVCGLVATQCAQDPTWTPFPTPSPTTPSPTTPSPTTASPAPTSPAPTTPFPTAAPGVTQQPTAAGGDGRSGVRGGGSEAALPRFLTLFLLVCLALTTLCSVGGAGFVVALALKRRRARARAGNHGVPLLSVSSSSARFHGFAESALLPERGLERGGGLLTRLRRQIGRSAGAQSGAAQRQRSAMRTRDQRFGTAFEACADLLIDPAVVVLGRKLAAGG